MLSQSVLMHIIRVRIALQWLSKPHSRTEASAVQVTQSQTSYRLARH